MKNILLKAILCSLVLWAKPGPSSAAPGFPASLDSLYARLTTAMFESYVLEGIKTVVLLPVKTEGAYETIISRNGNAVLVSRLTQRIESSSDPALYDVVVVEGSLLDDHSAGAVFLRITISDVRVEADVYTLKVRLDDVSPAGVSTVVESLTLRGRDAAILNYARPVQEPLHWLWLLPLSLVLLGGVRALLRKRAVNVPFLGGFNRAENVPFWRMTIASVLMLLLFTVVLLLVKRNAIEGHSYFEGAEVYFFIDRNSGLFFNAGESNFKNLTKEIMREACNEISYQILHPDTPALEKLGDYLTRVINWILERLGLERFKLRMFHDLKQADYTYAIYTFSAEDIEPLAAGNLAELVVDYDSVIAPVLELSPEIRHSSLILPLSTLYDTLVESRQETKRKKKFIILFTDATESLPQHVRTFQENLGRFYTRKDQYLRVFSVFFPNIPRTSSVLDFVYGKDRYPLYPFEEGKLLLLSKISEFIVYMNSVRDYTPARLREVDRLFYERLKGDVTNDSLTAANYADKLARYEALLARAGSTVPLTIHDVAAQNFLKNYVETGGSGDADAPVKTDFFLYASVTPDLYAIDKLKFKDRAVWDTLNNYNEGRGRLFGQPLDPQAVDRVVGDVVDTFVNQFIIIDKEVDKESLIFNINFWITIMAIGFSLFYALLLYRYKYDENYQLGGWDRGINFGMIVVVLIVLIVSLAYFRYENRWTIYGNWVWALGVSAYFLLSYYYLPVLLLRYFPVLLQYRPTARHRLFLFYVFVLPVGVAMLWVLLPVLFVAGHLTPLLARLLPQWQAAGWLAPRQTSGSLRDVTFDFGEAKSIKRLDRFVFNVLTVPLLAVALFLQILSPVYKQRVEASDDWFIAAMDAVYRSGLDLSDYNNVIEYFLLLWLVVAVIYLARTFVYSKKVAVVGV